MDTKSIIVPGQQPLAASRPEAQLIAEWHAALEKLQGAGDITATTATTYRNGLGKFVKWVSEKGVELVAQDVFSDWKEDLLKADYKPTTINTWLSGVKAFYTWAVGRGKLAYNPTLGVKGVKRKGTTKRHLRSALTDREVLAVLSKPDLETDWGVRDKAILCLMAYCGLRTVEVHWLNVDDLSTDRGYPVLRIRGKGSRETDEIAVVANPDAEEALYSWLSVRGGEPGPMFTSYSPRSKGERLGVSAIRHLVISYYRQAGIVDPRKTTHSLRHTAISKVVEKTGNVLKAQQVARHAKIDTTMVYVHETKRMEDPGEGYISYENGNGGE